MNANERKTVAAFRRIVVFLTPRPGWSIGNASKAVAELAAIVDHLEADSVAYEANRRMSKAAKVHVSELRRRLIGVHMRPIARMADVLMPTAGGRLGPLSTPRQGLGMEKLVCAARAMAATAQLHARNFSDNGLPEQFVGHLAAAANDYQLEYVRMTDYRKASVAATARVRRGLLRGRLLVRLLDAIMTPVLAAQPHYAGAWQSAAGIRRRGPKRKPHGKLRTLSEPTSAAPQG